MPKVESITSAANPLLKDIRKAVSKGPLTDDGLCIAESLHLIGEAARSQVEIPVIVAAESMWPSLHGLISRLTESRFVSVPDALFQTIASTENANGAMALVRPRLWKMDDVFAGTPLVVVLDGVQDPGNAGAIARAAEAFGATGMVCGKGTANPRNAKALRASAGSLFRLPCVTGMDGAAIATLLQTRKVAAYAGMPWSATTIAAQAVDFVRGCALIIGGEGQGVSPALLAIASPVGIPTVKVESLNAAVAAAILLYEASRQRT
ncbi:MAG TPA: RNA methyltransferase [Bryobacteraceae bacterium]|nr:RNA methyltransferase [Bryobacteraceae bacterium]